MGRFTLHLPKTLQSELEVLAKNEGISLNQYIVYTLTQKVTIEKLALSEEKLTPEQARLLAHIQLVSSEQVTEQTKAFEALLSRLGKAASDDEVEEYLAGREPVEAEPELNSEAVIYFKERIAQAKQSV